MLIAFVVISLLVVFTIYELNIFDISLAPQVKPTCITPPIYPQLIMQSGTICPRVYNYGIGIGANNIQVSCQVGTLFNGTSSRTKDGLTIIGKNNIVVNGCSFSNFAGHGAYITGQQNRLASNITLINIFSTNNGNDGLRLDGNTKNILVEDSNFDFNRLNGVTLTSRHIPDANNSIPVLLFPESIILNSNNIESNQKNGIHLDAFNYYFRVPSPNNQINISSILSITDNIIQHNQGDGIINTGFSSYNYNPNPNIRGVSLVARNLISSNNGSGISLLANYSNEIINASFFSGRNANFDYAIDNTITFNNLDGISVILPLGAGELNYNLVSINNIFKNIINNNRNGILFSSIPISLHLGQYSNVALSSFILQNKINYNLERGIYISGYPTHYGVPGWSDFEIDCNDILSNSLEGIKVEELSYPTVYIRDKNIIEGNTLEGIFFHNVMSNTIPNMGDYLVVRSNYIGSNLLGIKQTGQTNEIEAWNNDFENNTQHPQSFIAFPPQSTLWQNNWWNEYSPTCVDSQPDGWCDVDYPIPVQYFDYSPKAGTWWGHKLRGYLVEDNSGRGVILKSSCPVITLPFPGNSSIPGNGTSIPGNMSNPRGI